MKNSDENWWDAQCGEYVLGTLRGAERDVFEKILLVDSDAQKLVNDWQRKLGALANHMQTSQPPEHLLQSLLHKIHEQAGQKTTRPEVSQPNSNPDVADDLTGTWTEDIDSVLATDISGALSNDGEDTEQIEDNTIEHRAWELTNQPQPRNRLWKTLAIIATTATLLLGTLLLKQTHQNVSLWPISNSGNLSVVQDEKQQSLWLVTFAHSSAQATIVALAPPPILPEQSHHLWIVKPDEAGMISVGLLPRKTGQHRTIPLPETISKGAMFAVSLEEATGSSQPVPTGPVLFQSGIQQVGE